eukprot:CAMPEP_0171265352 /NCGR_PEP_ID=MMETSP0790-20130122/58079_1 /TAXON_ID=2925 /ORGANISM="Alexandrium catenella, Strain OF101" /LENGTH=51 /DNA_ID=CAMNT_0011734015 /DNA_START=107 /DNA_END=258 /DNA_ORIENTATION=+
MRRALGSCIANCVCTQAAGDAVAVWLPQPAQGASQQQQSQNLSPQAPARAA